MESIDESSERARGQTLTMLCCLCMNASMATITGGATCEDKLTLSNEEDREEGKAFGRLTGVPHRMGDMLLIETTRPMRGSPLADPLRTGGARLLGDTRRMRGAVLT